MKDSKIVLAAILVIAVSNLIANPVLFFDADNLEDLRQRAMQQDLVEITTHIISLADQYIDPQSNNYADSEIIDKGFEHRPLGVRGTFYGRRLTNWFEVIGFAYQITGEEKYGRFGANLLAAAVEKLPPNEGIMKINGMGGIGDMVRGLAIGYDWLGDKLSDQQRELFLDVSKLYAQRILGEAAMRGTWWVPRHNYIGVSVGAAGMLAIAVEKDLPELSQQWLDQSVRHTNHWYDSGFDSQGGYMEGIAYCQHGLNTGSLFAEAYYRKTGIELFEHPNIKNVPVYFAMSLLPGENVYEGRNDAFYREFALNPLLRFSKMKNYPTAGLSKWLFDNAGPEYTDRGYPGGTVFRVLWAAEKSGVSPQEYGLPKAIHFDGSGLCIWRTGWEKEDVMLTMESGAYVPRLHRHADQGSFCLYGLGQRWAVDLARARLKTKQHNCILIDGEGHYPDGIEDAFAGIGGSGMITAFEDNSRYGYGTADYTVAFAIDIDSLIEYLVGNEVDYYAESHGAGYDHSTITDVRKRSRKSMVMRAVRHSFLVRPKDGLPAYAVILDDIQKDHKTRDYTWLMHTPNTMKVQTRNGGWTIRPSDDDSVRLEAYMFASNPVNISAELYEITEDNRPPRSVITISALARADNPEFATVLLPLYEDSPVPDVQRKLNSIVIQWQGRKDTIDWQAGTVVPKIYFDYD